MHSSSRSAGLSNPAKSALLSLRFTNQSGEYFVPAAINRK